MSDKTYRIVESSGRTDEITPAPWEADAREAGWLPPEEQQEREAAAVGAALEEAAKIISNGYQAAIVSGLKPNARAALDRALVKAHREGALDAIRSICPQCKQGLRPPVFRHGHWKHEETGWSVCWAGRAWRALSTEEKPK